VARATAPCLAVMLIALTASTGEARASEASRIVASCAGTHPAPLVGFKQSAYEQALRELPTILAEYSPCPGLIREAELALASHRGRRGGSAAVASATVAPPTASEQQALEQGARGPIPPLRLGVAHVAIGGQLNPLPAPLLALLALLAALGLALGGDSVRRLAQGSSLAAWPRRRGGGR